VIDSGGDRDLAALHVPQAGALRVTGLPFEPYQLIGPSGEAVGPVAGLLEGSPGVRAAGDDATFVWDSAAAVVPVPLGGRGAVGPGDAVGLEYVMGPVRWVFS
jgi:hypothetical protein